MVGAALCLHVPSWWRGQEGKKKAQSCRRGHWSGSSCCSDLPPARKLGKTSARRSCWMGKTKLEGTFWEDCQGNSPVPAAFLRFILTGHTFGSIKVKSEKRKRKQNLKLLWFLMMIKWYSYQQCWIVSLENRVFRLSHFKTNFTRKHTLSHEWMQSCSLGGVDSPLLIDPEAPGISPKATEPVWSKGLTVLLEVTFQRLSPKMCLDSFKSQL